MVYMNNEYYVERRAAKTKGCTRDWWLVKYICNGYGIELSDRRIHLPKSFIGKRVRLKVEVLE